MSQPNGVDFDRAPFIAIWETTRACDLACVHCRALAMPEPAPGELSREEAFRLIEDIRAMGTKILVFTGGDPLKRPDLLDLIAHAKRLGLRTGAIPAVTPALTAARLVELKSAGLDQVAFSLDSADPIEHNQFRRTPGVFEHTLEMLDEASAVGLRTQINSLINVHNAASLDALIGLVESLGLVFWEVFFLVPTGRGKTLPLLTAQAFEAAFEKIHELSLRARFIVKVTEAPHYRRFVIEKKGGAANGSLALPPELRKEMGPDGAIGHAPRGVNAGKGFLFVSSTGEIYPSGFLPIEVGNVRRDALAGVYRESRLMKQLRDPAFLKGKCGRCPYNDLCGGSRARAYALTGDPFSEDPCCVYEPQAA